MFNYPQHVSKKKSHFLNPQLHSCYLHIQFLLQTGSSLYHLQIEHVTVQGLHANLLIPTKLQMSGSD